MSLTSPFGGSYLDPTDPYENDVILFVVRDPNVGDPGATITGRVWDDVTRNGIQDANEFGAAGVRVQLFDAAGNLVALTFTDAGGVYTFGGLPPASYRVRVIPPPSAQFAPKDAGPDDIDSDFDLAGFSDLISLPPDGLADLDAGLWLEPDAVPDPF